MDGRRPPTQADQHVALDIDTAWLESVKYGAAMSLERKPQAKPTIFRVPPSVRCRNQRAYEPNVVSIGPYHRGKSKDLMAMEEIKWRLLHDYLSKVPNGSNNEGLRKLKDWEKPARDCYWEVIDLDSDKFVEMLLLDGCFLVQIFIAIKGGAQPAELFHNTWNSLLMFRDLLLLENQIPYFIVVHLLDMLEMPEWNSSHLQHVAISCFACFLPVYPIPGLQDQPVEGFPVDHLLHLFHKWIFSSVPKLEEVSKTRCYNKLSLEPLCSALSPIIHKTGDCLSKVLPCRSNSSVPEKLPFSIPGVTQLVEAGVKIEVRKANSFLDVVFCKDRGVLGIPAIEVDCRANPVFANLMALEQSSDGHGLKICAYTWFLGCLINTSRDVELLCQEGILQHCLGSDEEVASLFNNLVEDVIYYPFSSYLSNVFTDLNVYCQSRWPRWRAKAVHDYFNNPWAIISLGAAVLLLGLTIVQSVYTVLDHYRG